MKRRIAQIASWGDTIAALDGDGVVWVLAKHEERLEWLPLPWLPEKQDGVRPAPPIAPRHHARHGNVVQFPRGKQAP